MSRLIYRSKFHADFGELEKLLLAHEHCLKDTEREDILSHLCARVLNLKHKVLEAERAGRAFLNELRDLVVTPQTRIMPIHDMEKMLHEVDQRIAARLYDERRVRP